MYSRAYKTFIRKASREALRLGIIKPPTMCNICGVNEWDHIHHKDYSKPLDVEFLCIKCHIEQHEGLMNTPKHSKQQAINWYKQDLTRLELSVRIASELSGISKSTLGRARKEIENEP